MFNLAPGPGNYKIPSEFGYYEAKEFALKNSTSRIAKKKRNANKENTPLMIEAALF